MLKDTVSCGAFQQRVEQLCRNGFVSEGIEAVQHWHHEGRHVSSNLLYCILEACMHIRSLAAGREAHRLVVRTGSQSSLSVGRALIRMFAVCGSVSDANYVFGQLREPDVYVWMAIISANSKLGHDEKALRLYQKMQESSLAPDGHVVVAALKSCIAAKAITTGKLIHFQIIENGLEADAFVGNTLINFYAKFARFDDVWGVFDRFASRDLVTWSAMIGGHVEHSQPLRAIQLFCKMRQEDIEPDRIIILCILKACSSLTALVEGRLLHIHVLKRNLAADSSLLNTIIDMYVKCGHIEDAKKLFEMLQSPDLVAWNVMISGCVHAQHDDSAFWYYCKLLQQGWLPSHVTYVSILKACSYGGALLEGMLIHCDVIECGLQSHVIVGNSLVDMYTKCNKLEDAECIFSNLHEHNVVTWNAMIAGHAQLGYAHKAVGLFQCMLLLGVEPNNVTFITVLKALSSSNNFNLYQGKLIHCYANECVVDSGVLVSNALIYMYANCGSFDFALWVFGQTPQKDIVTYNTILAGCAEFECNEKALQFFRQMQHEGLDPDEITCNCMLKITPSVAALQQGRSVHDLIIECGFDSNILIGNSLIDMYCRRGSLEEACDVFTRLPKEDVVTYNVMLEGYALHGFGEDAHQLFKHMQQSGLLPDRGTFISIIKAVCCIPAVQRGKFIHIQVAESPYVSDMLIGNSLLDMYAKCGSLEGAFHVFERMPQRDAIVWCSMIALCAKHSNPKLALHHFKAMIQAGINPTDATVVSLLSSFSHAGEVHEGFSQLKSVIENCNDALSPDLCNCVADLLGRVGQLNDAENFLRIAPFRSNLAGWTSLLSNCKTHGNVDVARRCFNHLSCIEEVQQTFSLSDNLSADIGLSMA